MAPAWSWQLAAGALGLLVLARARGGRAAGGSLRTALPGELAAMLAAARLAGREIRASWLARLDAGRGPMDAAGGSSGDVAIKVGNSADLQTEVDRRCEDIVVAHLRRAFPQHAFVGEEATSSGSPGSVTRAATFVIDPIDGTTNFVHTCLGCSVLVAFMVDREVRAGVILDPIHGECFYAWRGGGAWLQRLDDALEDLPAPPLRLRTTGERALERAMVATDVGHHRSAGPVQRCLELQRELLVGGKVRGMRVIGGCGLGLAYVAAGRFDAYVELHSPWVWDFAAGSLIVNEAGGKACNPLTGGSIDWDKRDILAAASPALADILVKLVAGNTVLAKQVG